LLDEDQDGRHILVLPSSTNQQHQKEGGESFVQVQHFFKGDGEQEEDASNISSATSFGNNTSNSSTIIATIENSHKQTAILTSSITNMNKMTLPWLPVC